jgi:hypothetical protein
MLRIMSIHPSLRLSLLLLSVLGVPAFVLGQETVPGVTSASPGKDCMVKAAKDLGLTATDGENVLVLDHSWIEEAPEASRDIRHRFGRLILSRSSLGSGLILKGKIFVPSDAPMIPSRLEVRLLGPKREETLTASHTYAEVFYDLQGDLDKWTDFEVDIPVNSQEYADVDEIFIVNLTLVPLSGPVYFDEIRVLDDRGGDLWQNPSFE